MSSVEGSQVRLIVVPSTSTDPDRFAGVDGSRSPGVVSENGALRPEGCPIESKALTRY
jgi:hypothetical protein